MSQSILKMEQIVKSFGAVNVLKGVDFDLAKGEVHALVGGNGAGKSTLMKIMTGVYTKDSGKIIIKGEEKEIKSTNDAKENGIAMIFQDPMTCMNPTTQVGKQIVEAIQHHRHLSKAEAKAEAIKYLSLVNIPNPEERAKQYPHEFSGGMRQRCALIRTLATDPEIIYFDEPTSALDPELTGEVLSVMRQLAEEGMTMLVVTHEMGFARNVSSKTVFMENGVVVEQAPSHEFFANPKEERTREFLRKIAHTE